MNISIKTREEIEVMKEGGEILSRVIIETLKKAKPGVKTIELENFAADLIKKAGALASFKTVENYQFATCICVNDCVVHGLPKNYILKKGDILGVDCGVLWKGFHTDASWTIIVGEENTAASPRQKFLEIGKEALSEAIKAAIPGNYIWDIGKVIEDIVEKKGGYHVVHALTGHGIGRKLHEDPFIPGYPSGKRENSEKIVEGMTLAIEVIYGASTGEVWYGNSDGWTITTRDGSDAGLFEVTIAVTSGSPLILTHLA